MAVEALYRKASLFAWLNEGAERVNSDLNDCVIFIARGGGVCRITRGQTLRVRMCAALYERGLSVCAAASRRIIVCPGDEAAERASCSLPRVRINEQIFAKYPQWRSPSCGGRTLRADDTFLQQQQQPRPNGH